MRTIASLVSLFVLLVSLSGCHGAGSRSAAAIGRPEIQAYLSSVYTAVPASSWDQFTDSQLSDWFNSLTFYYEGYPALSDPNREHSYPFDSNRCNCYLPLPTCLPYSGGNCPDWPLDTYLNLDFVKKRDVSHALPANSWFEGITYPGEWGFPLSCLPQGAALGAMNHFDGQLWLYPTTGTGIWFNTKTTAAHYNKIAWLVEFGIGVIGNTKTEIMDTLTNIICPGYRNLTSCEDCVNPADPTRCCCHGIGSRNLGTQVYDVKVAKNLATWEEALDATADIYASGSSMGNEVDPNPGTPYPFGSFFNLRNGLDPSLRRVQRAKGITTAQFIREPQHLDVHLLPAYAFELLLDDDAADWKSFCNTPNQLALLDPTGDLTTYTQQGWVDGSVPTQPLTSWHGRPDFIALFLNTTVSTAPTATHSWLSSIYNSIVEFFQSAIARFL